MKKMPFVDRVCVLITTIFGVGYSPFFPGTLASILAVLIFLAVRNNFYYAVFTAVSLILSFLLSCRAERIFNEKDSKKIVIDDFCGMLISLLFLPRAPQFIFCAFFLFRGLDMVKIPPADKIEKYSGALGIVGDDVIAAIYTNIILHLARGILAISVCT